MERGTTYQVTASQLDMFDLTNVRVKQRGPWDSLMLVSSFRYL